MNYEVLQAAWSAGLPAGVTGRALVAGMTTQQKLDAVNAWTVVEQVDVSVADVESYLSMQGLLTAFEDWLDTLTVPAPQTAWRTAVKELLRTVASPHVTTFRTADPATYAALKGMVDAIRTGGLMSQAQHDAVLAMAAANVNWCLANGYPYDPVRDVGNLTLSDLVPSNAGLS